MLKNFIKVGLRNLLRNKGVSLINISGLSIGIACSLLIFAYVVDEINYDDFYVDGESLYRVQLHRTFPGRESWFATSPVPMGPTLSQNMPEIEQATRMFRVFNEVKVSRNRIDNFYETRVLAADSNFLKVFSFPILEGTRQEALLRPNSVVLTKSSAERYFGRTEVVGESLALQDSLNFKVTAVIDDLPKRSHFEFDLLLSFNSFPQIYRNNFWGAYTCYNYVKLKKTASAEIVEQKIPSLVEQYMAPQVEAVVGSRYEDYVAAGNLHNYFLVPARDIYLNSNFQNEIKPNGNINNVYFFSLIAVLILMIACFNFMNLSTAASVKRAKEVGMRKVLGSHKGWLVAQFITESTVLTVISTIVGGFVFIYALPFFNDLAGKSIDIYDFSWIVVTALLIVFVLLIGLFSGSYPAFFISSFSTLKVLRGGLKLKGNRYSLRNLLVIAQFAVSIFLVMTTLLIFRQTNHMRSQRLGFDKEKILVIERANSLNNIEQFKNALKRNSAIDEVSASAHVPGRLLGGGTFEAIGIPATERFLFRAMNIDYDFASTYGLKLVKGRFFDPNLPSDSASIVINEAAVEMVGWEDPIGKEVLPTNGNRLKIIGVVEDFHFASLHEKISPLVLFGIPRQNLSQNPPGLMSLRILGGNRLNEVLDFVGTTWNEWNPGNQLEYGFLDAQFDELYQKEQNFASIFSAFAILAIFIALVGVLGLSAFVAAQRIREIAVRKVLGAKINQLMYLLSMDFVKLVLIANVVVAPVAYLVMNDWLDNYPYSVKIPIDLMLLTALLSLVLIVTTVSFHAYRAAVQNPAKTLKCE